MRLIYFALILTLSQIIQARSTSLESDELLTDMLESVYKKDAKPRFPVPFKRNINEDRSKDSMDTYESKRSMVRFLR